MSAQFVIPAAARMRGEPGPRGGKGPFSTRLGPGYFADAKFRDDRRIGA